MRVNSQSVHIGFMEVLDLLKSKDISLWQEATEHLQEVAEIAWDTNPNASPEPLEEGFGYDREGIFFATNLMEVA